MFAITGSWQGKMVQNHPVSVKELMDTFNIHFPEKSVIKFGLNLNNKRIANVKDGVKVYSQRRSYMAVVDGIHENQSFRITYYERNLGTKDNPKFQPRKIEFLGNPVSFKKDTELERAVILALNNRCQTSPFLESSVGFDFFIVDDEKDARTKIEKARRLTVLRDKVLKHMNDEQVLTFAKGFRGKNRGALTITEDTSALTCRALLMEQLEQDPEWFEKALNSPTHIISGVVQNAYDKGEIKSQKMTGGVIQWNWANGEPIASVEAKRPGAQGLIEYLISSGKDKEFLNKIGFFVYLRWI
jgi:hypothetical protein